MLEGSEQQTSQVEPSTVAAEEVTFHMPQGPNLAGPNGRQLAAESAAAGLEALPHMAEIYPLGGQALLSALHSKLSKWVYVPAVKFEESAVGTTGKHSVHVQSQIRIASTAATHVLLSSWSYI